MYEVRRQEETTGLGTTRESGGTGDVPHIPGGCEPFAGEPTGVRDLRGPDLAPRPATAVAALLGLALGLGWLLLGLLADPADTQIFSTIHYLTWVFLVVALITYWSAVIPPLWQSLGGLARDFHVRRRRAVAIASGMFLAALLLFRVAYTFGPPLLPPLAHFELRLAVLYLLGGAASIPGSAGILLVCFAVSQTRLSGPRDAEFRVKLVKLLDLRGWLSWYTAILGTAIGLLVLTTGALRNAIVAAPGGQDGRFAPEGVLLYGAFFSALLASIYIPAYLGLADAGQRMRDQCFPLSRRWENAEAWAAWYRQRKDFEEFLGLRLGTVASLRGVVGVLTPLASSAVSLLLGKG